MKPDQEYQAEQLDRFAAAALTGLLSVSGGNERMKVLTSNAYGIARAMMEEAQADAGNGQEKAPLTPKLPQ